MKYESQKPTAILRWAVLRSPEGEFSDRVLQQKWVIESKDTQHDEVTIREEWRPIPEVTI